jgi:hypothetical protein
MEATDLDDEAIVGDECHIVARSPDGPRGDASWTENQLDAQSNLILLCKTHHKLIDDQPNTFNTDILRAIKQQHELWVKTSLDVKLSSRISSDTIAISLTSGQDIVTIISNTFLLDLGADTLESEEEVEIISNFIQEIKDYSDIIDHTEGGDTIRIAYEWTKKIRELDKLGLRVFGTKYQHPVNISGKIEQWQTAYIRIVRSTNPLIKSLVDK